MSLLACLVVAGRVKRWPYNRRPYYGSSYFRSMRAANQPQCTANNQCFNYMIILSVSGAFSLTGNATQFRLHYEMLGLNRVAMIRDGKKAAAILKRRYGVDATNLPDETYLAPLVQLGDGITFNFVTVSPTLYLGAQTTRTQLYNIPASVGWYNIDFSKDYVSTGTFKGTIPAGSKVYYGSFVVNTCQGRYRCNSLLSNKPKGQLVLRFFTKSFVQPLMPGPFVRIDSVLEHEEWGTGRARGVFITDQATGITNGNEVHTFPESCDPSVACYTQGNQRHYG